MSLAYPNRSQYAAPYQPGWNSKPPYQGAPPPMPQGWGVNQYNWSNGVWRPNPHFNPANQPSAPAQLPWSAKGWNYPPQQQQQQQQNVNPYKRPVRPLPQDYLAQKLSDNPLGLTNMVPRDQVYAGQMQNEQHTPWIWLPRGLVEEEEDDSDNEQVISAVYRDENNGKRQEDRGIVPTRKPPSRQPSVEPENALAHGVLQRHGTDPTDGLSRSASTRALIRHSSEPPMPPPPASAPATQPSGWSAPHSGELSRRNTTDTTPTPSTATSPVAGSSSAKTPTRAHSMPPQSFDPDHFTKLQPLRPTFSTSIIRTPGDYRQGLSRRNSLEPESSASRSSSPQRHSVIEDRDRWAVMDAMVNDMRLNGNDKALVRSSGTSGHSSLSGVSQFVDEPQEQTTPPSNSRQLGRHHTAPTLSAIPESSPEQQYQAPSQQLVQKSKSKSGKSREGGQHSFPGGSQQSSSNVAASGSSSQAYTSASQQASHQQQQQPQTRQHSPYSGTTPTSAGQQISSASQQAASHHSQIYRPAVTSTSASQQISSASQQAMVHPRSHAQYTPPTSSTSQHISSASQQASSHHHSRPHSHSQQNTPPDSTSHLAPASQQAANGHQQHSPYHQTTPPMPASRKNSVEASSASQHISTASQQAAQSSHTQSQQYYGAQTTATSASQQASRSSHTSQQYNGSTVPTSTSTSTLARRGTMPEISFASQHAAAHHHSRTQQQSQHSSTPSKSASSNASHQHSQQQYSIYQSPPPASAPATHSQHWSSSQNLTMGAFSTASAVAAAVPHSSSSAHKRPSPPTQPSAISPNSASSSLSSSASASPASRPRAQAHDSHYLHGAGATHGTNGATQFQHHQNSTGISSASAAAWGERNARHTYPGYPHPPQSLPQTSSAPQAAAAATSSSRDRDRARHTHPSNPPKAVALPQTSPARSPYSSHPNGTSSASTSTTTVNGARNDSLPSTSITRRPRRRIGYWNKRGDHLLFPQMQIVYAPTDKAYPAELADYPDGRQGFMDEFGTHFGWADTFREFVDSLPRHGNPPLRPYESFIKYDKA